MLTTLTSVCVSQVDLCLCRPVLGRHGVRAAPPIRTPASLAAVIQVLLSRRAPGALHTAGDSFRCCCTWNCFLNFLSDCALLVNGNITNVCVDLVTCKFMELFSFLLRSLGFSYRVASFVNGDGFTSALVPANRCRQNLCSAAGRRAGQAPLPCWRSPGKLCLSLSGVKLAVDFSWTLSC